MTVTLIKRTKTGTDADGNDVYATTEQPIAGAIVWPRSSSELVQGQDVVIVGLQLVVPPGTVIAPTDQVQVGSDVYEVDGQPGDWSNPFTGWDAGIEVALTKVTG